MKGTRTRHGRVRWHGLLSAALLASSMSASGAVNLSSTPLFVTQAVPPLAMLIMGRDHRLYYEAYNDI